MTIKEMPLVKAVSHHGPFPSWFFSNPFVSSLVFVMSIGLCWGVVFIFFRADAPVGVWPGIFATGFLFGLLLANILMSIAIIRGLIIRDQISYHLLLACSVLAIDMPFFIGYFLLNQ